MSTTPSNVVVAHWSTLIENFQASPLSFYGALEAALARREVPQTQKSRVEHREGGALSATREYLHVTRENLLFDVCAAPFGTGFFVSWWLAEDKMELHPILKVIFALLQLMVAGIVVSSFGFIVGTITLVIGTVACLIGADALAKEGTLNDSGFRSLPLLGTLYNWLFKPTTYYRIDTMEMFQKAVHNAVLEVIDSMTIEKGVRALAESERKPIMRDFYDRTR